MKMFISTTDATRLKQVICNFINNARKFTQKKDIFILGIRLITENDGFSTNICRRYRFRNSARMFE